MIETKNIDYFSETLSNLIHVMIKLEKGTFFKPRGF